MLPLKSESRRFQDRARIARARRQGTGHTKRFRFLNAEQFGTIRAVQPFNRFPLATAGNRL
jgi:hypothetical protein